MSNDLVVRHLEGDRFAVDVRGHSLLVDQPTEAGGGDTAPTPTEFFVAGLASCVAFYARRYLARHHIQPAGLIVSASFEIGGRPTRVHGIKIVVTPPVGLPTERRDAFLAVASHCTVHNTLTEPADVEIALAANVVALN
jgi:putative redox protein